MTTTEIGIVLSFAATLACSIASSAQQSQPAASRNAHVVNSFRFEVAAPMKTVAPLFAPEAERSWAGDNWNPVFAYPQPGRDVEGAVFTVKHGPFNSIWVTTIFNVEAGRMQYVAVVADKFAMTVDVQVIAISKNRTGVEVTYTRTALDPQLNEHVKELGEQDKSSGPEWQHGIEVALGLDSKP